MGLRAKLATTFLVLLALAIFAISVVSLDRTLRVMAGSLADSGDRITKEIFEQMRGALSSGARDPMAALRTDRGLRTAMRSAQAFSEYVVYVWIAAEDGHVLVTTEPAAEGTSVKPARSMELLRQQARSPLPLDLLPALWGYRTYEVSAPVTLDGHPFATIKVGISTGLIAADVHRLVAVMLAIMLVSVLLTSLAATFLGNRMLRPVLAITSGVEQLAAGGSGEVRFEIGSRDELGTLADRFNQLARRVRSERARWETERGRLVDVFSSMADAVLLIDSDGSLLFANEEARRKLGLDSGGGKGEGKQLGLLLGTDHPLMQLIGPVLSVGGDVHDVALELRDGGNGAGRFLVSIFSLGQGSAPAGLLLTLRDLARMDELKSVVDYSSRLARLGSLLSGVAHQVRGRLNAMTMQLELLRQDAEQGRVAEQRVERVRQELKRLERAVDALMRFMRPQQVKAEEIAINDVLLQIGGRVNQPGIKVEYKLEKALPQVVADSALLTEALQNVVQNAVEAMPGGGVLELRTALVGNGLVEIEIADQGTGISSSDLERIFDLYFTTKQSGSGLGLPLALRAIDLMGGALNVESEVGVGTVFRIRLPAVKDAGLPTAHVRAS